MFTTMRRYNCYLLLLLFFVLMICCVFVKSQNKIDPDKITHDVVYLIDNTIDSSSHAAYSKSIYDEDVRKRYETIEKVLGGIENVRPWEGLKGGYYLWDLFPPSFNCPYRERLGKFSEGGKVICNWQALEDIGNSCNVFSFGIRDDVSFEIDLAKRTKCNIYGFDPSVSSLPNNLQEYQPCPNGGKIMFESVGLGSKSEIEKTNSWKLFTLEDLMTIKSVSTIDLLKIDIEGSEWDVFEQLKHAGTLKNVQQLSIELHFKQKDSNLAGTDSGIRDVVSFFRTCEEAGLYAFSWEVNMNPPGYFGQRPWAIEYSFVRADSPFMEIMPYGQGIRSCHKPERDRAIVTLSRGDPSGMYEDLINRTLSIAHHKWATTYDFLIFHENDLLSKDQIYIREMVPPKIASLITFVNVDAIFSKHKHYPINKKTKLSENFNCSPTALSLTFREGYHLMCSFWFIDIYQLHISKNYKYFLRIDDDILISEDSIYDPFLEDSILASVATFHGMDHSDVITGLDSFLYSISDSDIGRRFNLSWNNQTWISPYSNVMWMNMEFLRSPKMRYIRKQVANSHCIFSNRWGDLPLYGALMKMLGNLPVTGLNLKYFHGSHNAFVVPTKK